MPTNEELEIVGRWRSMARKWAPLAGVEIRKCGEAYLKNPDFWVWEVFSPARFHDLPGAKSYSVSFLASPKVAKVPEAADDLFMQRWMMAMISLHECINEANGAYNYEIAKRLAGEGV